MLFYFQLLWCHQMETFSALLAICPGNSLVPGESLSQRPVTRSFDVFFDLRLNKRLSEQSWGWWFETLSRPLWRSCNASVEVCTRLDMALWIFYGVYCISHLHRVRLLAGDKLCFTDLFWEPAGVSCNVQVAPLSGLMQYDHREMTHILHTTLSDAFS